MRFFRRHIQQKNNLDEIFEEKADLELFLPFNEKVFAESQEKEDDILNVGEFFDMFLKPFEREIK